MAIDWTKPLEAIHRNGKITSVELEENEAQPDQDGDYIIVDTLDCGIGYGPQVFHSDGTAWIEDGEEWCAWAIRNRE